MATSDDYRDEGKGLLKGLFDFSFTTFVTVKFAKVIYVLLLLGWAAGWLAFIVVNLANDMSGAGTKLAMILLVFPIGGVLSLVYIRVIVESIVVIFRIAENTASIAGRHSQGPAQGQPPVS